MPDSFDNYRLSYQSIAQMEQFLRFLDNRPSHSILYDFLIIGDPGETALFSEEFLRNCCEKGLLDPKRIISKDLKSLLKINKDISGGVDPLMPEDISALEQFFCNASYDVMVLHAAPEEEPDFLSKDCLLKFFRMIASCARSNPEKIIFLCLSKEISIILSGEECGYNGSKFY